MTESLCHTHPDKSREKIEAFVEKKFKERYQDHSAVIYNSYENTVADTSLNQVLDWIQVDKPLIAESGVFFYPKDKKRNVNVEIIKECMLDRRVIDKNAMYEYMKKGDTFNAAVKDLAQANDKKAANSGYGAEGQSSSFFYNTHSAMSVTSCGRGQISTACQCFDNLLADYVKFFDMNEFHTWVNHICSENQIENFQRKMSLISFQVKEFVRRYVSKFLHESLVDVSAIERTYDYLNPEERIRVYYKANLHKFLLNNKIRNVYAKISGSKCDFVDPNNIPDEIYPEVILLSELVTNLLIINIACSDMRIAPNIRNDLLFLSSIPTLN